MIFKLAKVVLLLSFPFLFVQASSESCFALYEARYSGSEAIMTRIRKAVKNNIPEAELSEIDAILHRTRNSDALIETLLKPLKRNELEDMYFRVRLPNGNEDYIKFYRNADFLDSLEFVITKTPPSGPNIIKNVQFGYRNIRNENVQSLGNLMAIEMDTSKTIRKVYFLNETQRDKFKAHFFGRPFDKKMRNRIVQLNTEIFSALSQIPNAVKKVSEFEKSRGWPGGTAKRLGLVYYSNAMFDLKSWAIKNRVRFDDMVNAGWLRQSIRHDGHVTYTENYDDSIKIPFYDPKNKNRVAFWRTRNLGSKPGLPKYLSWPKDRSLFEVETLFEELYNGWNLDKAKGRKVVITEGEFKCAIGEMVTGIFHLGIPGISQFSSTMLENLIKAQPSEVVVLFDRDPVGKGLVRLDEVTDSQRASYSIAKRIEAAGIPVKVTSLPDVFNGGKVGIDDLLLGFGAEPYLKALKQAQSPDSYATLYKIDVEATDLTFRKNKVNKALRQFEQASNATLGSISFEQRRVYQELLTYHAMLELAYKYYIKTKYPGRQRLTDPSSQFEIINFSSRMGKKEELMSETETFAADGPVLKLGLKLADVKKCTNRGCFEINRGLDEWKKLDQKQKFDLVSQALVTIFPLDDYTYIEAPMVRGKIQLLLVIRKDSRSPVAIVDEF